MEEKKSIVIVGGGKNIDYSFLSEADQIMCVNSHFLRQGLNPNFIFYSGKTKLKEVIDYINNQSSVCHTFFINFPLDVNKIYEKDERIELINSINPLITVVRFNHFQFFGANPVHPEYEWSNIFSKKLKTLPLSGALALKYVTRGIFSKIYVTGFDLYSQDDFSIPYQIGSHKLEPHLEWFNEVKNTDSRVVFDEHFLKVLELGYISEYKVFFSGNQRFVFLKND